MLRITTLSQTSEEVVLRVEGWVAEAAVELLEEEGRRWLQQGRRLILDLEGVQFADEAGLELLQHWQREGIALHGGSRFVQALLGLHHGESSPFQQSADEEDHS
jgi:ABC-type transporter Mla MlaB component